MRTLIERMTPAGSEGARRATGDRAGRAAAGVPDPEVSEQAKRRRFTAEYKLRIVTERYGRLRRFQMGHSSPAVTLRYYPRWIRKGFDRLTYGLRVVLR